MPSIKTQDLYRALITEEVGIAASGDASFTVTTPPNRTNGFLVLSPDNSISRETVYYHDVVGNRIYVRGVNRKSPKFHPKGDAVQMNDVEEIFNFYSDMTSPLFYTEKTGGLNVRVWGGTVLVNGEQQTVADTNLTLTDNTTNYIVYDYVTNIVSVNTTGVGLVKATAIVVSGLITSITYNIIKESYINKWSFIISDIQKQSFIYWVDSGVANTHIVSITPAILSYSQWMKISFKSNFTNTSATSVNINGLWVVPIKKQSNIDCSAWEIKIGQIVEIIYDGSVFQIVSQVWRDKIKSDFQSKASISPSDTVLVGDMQDWIFKNVLVSQLNPFIASPETWDKSVSLVYNAQWRLTQVTDLISMDVININWDNIWNWTLTIQKVWDPKVFTATYLSWRLSSVTYI